MKEEYCNNQGIKYTSSHVLDVYNQGSKESAGALPVFDCGAVFDPFCVTDQNQVAEASRIPIVCIRCAAYLNIYSVVLNETGEWICPLCKSVNPSFSQALTSLAPRSNPATGYGFIQPDSSNMQPSRNSQLCDSYTELRASHCDFYEDIAPSSFSASTSGKSSRNSVGCFIFALDVELCNDSHVINMLCSGISLLPELVEVCVVLYGRHVCALRLGGGLVSSGNPLVSDVIPGSNDRTELYAHLIARGSYGVPAGILKSHLEVLRQGLATFGPSTDAAALVYSAHSAHHALSNQVQCTLDALISFVVALGSVYNGSNTEAASMSRLALFSTRSITCRGTLSSAIQSTKRSPAISNTAAETLSLYSSLGAWAYSNHCSIDVFNASLRAANLDQLDALVGPSGGCVVAGSAYEDSHIRTSFENYLKRSKGAAGAVEMVETIMPTLEIRTCHRLVVDRIVGPIVSAADVVLHNTHNKDKTASISRSGGNDEGKLTPTEAGLAIDSAHLAHSVYYLEQQNSTKSTNSHATSSLFGSSSSGDNETPVAKLYGELVRRNQQEVVISGINMRLLNHTKTSANETVNSSKLSRAAVSIQFKVSNEKNPDTLYSKGNALIGQVGIDAQGVNSLLQNPFAFVQIVVRFVVKRVLPGSSVPITQKVTRIYTQRLTLTTDREEYLRFLDPTLWAVVVSRGLVADHHTLCMQSFGGAMRNHLDQEGRYAFEALRADAVRTVDELVTAIVHQWPHSTSFSQEKVLRACRLLFQLREGPLLDGPSADHMEAYLLRSIFLKAEYSQALRLIMPAFTIHSALSYEPADEMSVPTIAQSSPLAALSAQYPPPSSAPTSALTSSVATAAYHASTTVAPPVTPPPSSQYAPPPGPPPSSSSIQALYPPPSMPPSNSATTNVPTAGVPNTLLFPPPPTPPPALGASFTFPTVSKTISSSGGQYTSQRNTDCVSLSMAPDSIGLLPGTIAVLDCGDRIIVRKNALRNHTSSTQQQASALQGGSAAASKLALEVNDLFDESTQALLARLEQKVKAVAATRYPVPSVFVLPRAGTPQDRMLYCRLMPAHTDTRDSLHTLLLNSAEVPHLLSVNEQSDLLTAETSAAQVAPGNSAWRRLTHGLSAQDIDDFLAPLPYTDQPFFAKYLSLMVPAQASKLLSKVASPAEETRRAAPVSVHMDRGPAAVFAPPVPPPSQNGHRAGFMSSADMLPL